MITTKTTVRMSAAQTADYRSGDADKVRAVLAEVRGVAKGLSRDSGGRPVTIYTADVVALSMVSARS